MKKLLLNTLFAAAFIGALPLAAAKIEYKGRTLDEKLAEPGVRFLATFDKRHINSDKASGYKKSLSHSGISLDLRGAMGFDDNPAYIPALDEELAYMLKKNLDIKNGALSFWFRCDEFDPADANLKKNIGIFNVEIPLKNGVYNTFGYIFGYYDDTTSDYITSTSSYTAQFISDSTSTRYMYYIPKSLETVVITKQTNIPFAAFMNCDLIKSITLPDNTVTIGGVYIA